MYIRFIKTFNYLKSMIGKKLYYVIDSAKWSFFWDGFYITEELRKIGLPAIAVRNVTGLRNQVIHYGNRFAFLNGQYNTVHPSNKLFLTWFHGDLNDPNAHIQKLLGELHKAASLIEKVVISCEATRHAMVKTGIEAEKICRIPLGVDLDRFRPVDEAQKQIVRRQLCVPENAICIGSFQKDGMGWNEGTDPKREKGPDVFLDVVARLIKNNPTIFVLLTGPARGYMINGLKKLGVRYAHFELENYQDIVSCYHALDMYLITSRSEGGPKAFLESWATGVPVVSTRMGMPADLITDMENGILAEVEDIDGLAGGIDKLIADIELRRRLSSVALKKVTDYSWAAISNQYYKNLYSKYFQLP